MKYQNTILYLICVIWGLSAVPLFAERPGKESLSDQKKQSIISRLQKTNPCSNQKGEQPIPRVTSYNLPEKGYIGMKLTIKGTNFNPDKIRVCIGRTSIPLTAKSPNEVTAQLPDSPLKGDLVISHGTLSSVYPLDEDYRVYGDAQISQVTPLTFQKGDTVTVKGTDLGGLVAGLEVDARGAISGRWLKISSSPSSNSGEGFFRVWDWKLNKDETQLTFSVSAVGSAGTDNRILETSPQPAQLSGTLRFVKPGSNQFTIVGPNVTWKLAGLSLTSVTTPAWGNSSPNFILAKNQAANNVLRITGNGLDGAKFKLGSGDVRASISASGLDGLIEILASTPSGKLTATKGGSTVTSAKEFTVIPEPAFLPNTFPSGTWKPKVDQVIELKGWDLKPSFPGLTYKFMVNSSSEANCKFKFEIISHTASSFKFKLAKTGAIPESCTRETPGVAVDRLFFITATYNGVERELFRKVYELQP